MHERKYKWQFNWILWFATNVCLVKECAAAVGWKIMQVGSKGNLICFRTDYVTRFRPISALPPLKLYIHVIYCATESQSECLFFHSWLTVFSRTLSSLHHRENNCVFTCVGLNGEIFKGFTILLQYVKNLLFYTKQTLWWWNLKGTRTRIWKDFIFKSINKCMCIEDY